MEREQVRCVVKTVLAVMLRIARKTSTPADDMMVGVLELNEDRIVDAVLHMNPTPNCQPPTDQQVVDALKAVGIKV